MRQRHGERERERETKRDGKSLDFDFDVSELRVLRRICKERMLLALSSIRVAWHMAHAAALSTHLHGPA